MRLVLPRLYVILDAALLTVPETECAQKLAAAGVRLLQYRNKSASSRELFESSKRLASQLAPQGITFVVNDRADVASVVDASGVHVGQDDLSVEAARRVIGTEKWVGVSTHNLEQFERAAATSADYIAVGPVFATSTKANPDPVVGIDFIRRARTAPACASSRQPTFQYRLPGGRPPQTTHPGRRELRTRPPRRRHRLGRLPQTRLLAE